MSSPTGFNVAIIGAGLSGLALALALHQQKIQCVIYEGRAESYDVGGAMMVMPNGVKVFQALGIEPKIRELGFSFEKANFQLAQTGAIVESIRFGGEEEYGCKALRIYRSALLKELLNAVLGAGIPVHFNHKFDKVVAEDHDGIEFAFTDGTTKTASLVVGADGIHSRVREYIAPGVESTFQGAAAIFAAVPTAQLGLPKDNLKDLAAQTNKWPLPTGIVNPAYGAFVIAPQTHNGDEVLITVQRPFPKDTDESEFKRMRENKQELIDMLQKNSEHFPDIVQNAVSKIDEKTIIIWPFYHIPHMDKWTSELGRAVLVGDSAHALPPSAGQGLNQALEDVYLLALTLAKQSLLDSSVFKKQGTVQVAVHKWQQFRQSRIDHVLTLNKQMDLRRMPIPPGTSEEEIAKRKAPLDFHTIYNINYTSAIEGYLKNADAVPSAA